MKSFRLRAGLISLAMVGASVTGAGTAGAADDPIFASWSDVLPGLTDEYDPSSENPCVSGDPRCVDMVIKEMQRRFRPLARKCSHQAIFSLSYLRTTQEYQRATAEPGFFIDPLFVNHEDAVFAKYYVEAYDAWTADRMRQVPEAWRIALNAAKKRKVTGSGNLLLGINAHINRDLPYVLAGIGLVTPEGDSRKADHDKVNVFLNRVTEPLLAEASRRFDPTIDDINTPYGLSYTALMQLIVTWREAAWRNAERLVSAPDAATRAAVEDDIEASAAASARTYATQYAYGPLRNSAERDAFCQDQQ
ncbi:MAG: DUF5995 family protein [Actinomycetota bacterium]|nr:DUF5995 family protein [Actinomycetota bacterium]